MRSTGQTSNGSNKASERAKQQTELTFGGSDLGSSQIKDRGSHIIDKLYGLSNTKRQNNRDISVTMNSTKRSHSDSNMPPLEASIK